MRCHPINRRPLSILTLGLALVMVLVTACSQATPTPTAAPKAAAPTTAPATATAAPPLPAAVAATPTVAPATPTTVPATPTAAPATPTAQPTSKPAAQAAAVAPEALEATYVDLAARIGDLRSSVASWEKGGKDSLDDAQEAAEQIEALVGHVAWPEPLAGPASKIKAGMEPLAKALAAKDVAATKKAVAPVVETSHDLTHAFYEKWLPTQKDAKAGPMAAHAAYIDLSRNLADLDSAVDKWVDGDQDSLDLSQEKAERVEALVHALAWPKPMAEPIGAVEKALPALDKALDSKDATAAKKPMALIHEASHDLGHAFYEKWLPGVNGASDPLSVQVAYVDLASNISDLRSAIDRWGTGDKEALDDAQEAAERIDALVGHVAWPERLAGPVAKIKAGMEAIDKAFDAKNVAGAKKAVAPVGEASHDLTHGFYDKWLMSAGPGMGMGVAAR